MDIGGVLDLFRTKWQMIPSEIFLLGTGFLCFLILLRRIFKLRHVRREVKGKDLTIEMLREQLKLVDEHHKAREVVAKVPHVESRPRLKALTLHAGRTYVLNTFLEVTNQQLTRVPLNPFKEQIPWAKLKRPTDKDIERMAALYFLRDLRYITGYTDSQDHYIASTAAGHDVRRAYDQLPQALKATIEVLLQR